MRLKLGKSGRNGLNTAVSYAAFPLCGKDEEDGIDDKASPVMFSEKH